MKKGFQGLLTGSLPRLAVICAWISVPFSRSPCFFSEQFVCEWLGWVNPEEELAGDLPTRPMTIIPGPAWLRELFTKLHGLRTGYEIEQLQDYFFKVLEPS